MRAHDLVIGLIVLQGCVPTGERDDPDARHFSGVEWLIDRDGSVVATRAVLVERRDGGDGRVIGVGADVAGSSESAVPLVGSLRGGVLRIVERRDSGSRVLDLTPVRADDFDERVRAREAPAATPSKRRRRGRWARGRYA